VREGSVWRTLLLVGAIAVAAALLVTASNEFSRDRITANERARLLQSLYSVLDPAIINENVEPVLISATDPQLLGSGDPIDVFIALDRDRPVAAIFASIAPDGYNAAIRLLIGISVDERITGVRVISHRETPGLGDAIEIRKSNWILQFDGTSLQQPEAALWAVEKDEGAFDSITGATVTPRAVIKAVKNTLLYFSGHKNELFETAQRVATERAESTDE
jgi:Na+-translocating ferredoxin:NAD+ oxidoreductase subunit G